MCVFAILGSRFPRGTYPIFELGVTHTRGTCSASGRRGSRRSGRRRGRRSGLYPNEPPLSARRCEGEGRVYGMSKFGLAVPELLKHICACRNPLFPRVHLASWSPKGALCCSKFSTKLASCLRQLRDLSTVVARPVYGGSATYLQREYDLSTAGARPVYDGGTTCLRRGSTCLRREFDRSTAEDGQRAA